MKFPTVTAAAPPDFRRTLAMVFVLDGIRPHRLDGDDFTCDGFAVGIAGCSEQPNTKAAMSNSAETFEDRSISVSLRRIADFDVAEFAVAPSIRWNGVVRARSLYLFSITRDDDALFGTLGTLGTLESRVESIL